MNKLPLLVCATVVALVSCGKPDNPLVTATEGQFAQWIEPKNAFSAPCAAALYEPELFVKRYNGLKFSAGGKISSVTEQQKSECVAELQKRASQIGIAGNVTPEHLFDDRVRQRYLSSKKG